VILAAALLLVLARPGDGQTVLLDGKAVEAAKLPDSVPKPVREAAVHLESWAEKHKIRIHIAENEPILLAVPAGFPSPTPMLQELEKARDDYVQRFGQKLADAALEVVYVETKEAYVGYVDGLVAREEYLKGWAAGAKETAGFWLHRPLAAAYFRNTKDPKEKSAEFNVRNQLVHQFGHLLANASIGRQPYWVQESIAWSLEQARENTIYAFCHRSGFVFRKDHGGWPKLGKAYLVSTGALPLDKIFAMDRTGDIPKDLGAGALALIDDLAAKHRDALTKCLAAFRADFDAKNGDPNYKIPIDKQKEMFAAAFGADAAKSIAAEMK
jgi:hypothetical protein